MSDLAAAAPTPTGSPVNVADDLARRAARLARSLASLLDSIDSNDGVTEEIIAFLRSYAGTIIPGEQSGAQRMVAGADRPASAREVPIDRLARRYDLAPAEVDAVLLAGLPEEHEGLARTFRSLHPLGEPHPSVGLLAQLSCDDHRQRSDVEGRLLAGAAVRSGLLTVTPGPTFYERSLVVGDALWSALRGHDRSWPATLDNVRLDPAPPGLDGWLASSEVRAARRALAEDDDRLLVLSCRDEAVALSRLAALAAGGSPLEVVRLTTVDRPSIDLAALHAAARGASLAAMLPAGGGATGEGTEPVSIDVDTIPGPVLVVTPARPIRPLGRRPTMVLPVGPVEVTDRRRAWADGLGLSSADAADLAARHPIDPAVIVTVAADLSAGQASTGGPQRIDRLAVAAAIRQRVGLVLPHGCRLVSPRTDRSRLILSDDATAHLQEAVDRLRYQSTVLDDWGFLSGARANRGARLLFTGPPGTGKSLAAEVMARDLGVDLLVADLSQIVSKWLGETEKNLSTLFDAAERSLAVLRFDEADALFANRTNVSDANDRYANLETAYLLQRLDDFEGLAILTTNLKQNIDRAVLRRMDAVVEFPVPLAPERRRLWAVHLPASAPRATDVDLDELADRYEMPGAWIRNATIAAAFMAAAEGSTIAQHHLLAAVRREYEKAYRPFPSDPESPG